MAQGRGNAKPSLVLGLAILTLLAITQTTFGAVYNVGWTFNMGGFTRGKNFKAGDVLAFSYPSNAHNVVQVSQAGYNSCNPGRARVFQSGRDRFTLRKGTTYFICSFRGHCQSGMKIAVTAS